MRTAQQPRTGPRAPVRTPNRTAPRAPQARPRITARPAPGRRAPKAPFVLLVIGLMCGGLVTLLLLNTMLAQGSYQEKDLRSSIEELRQQAAAQEAQLRRDGQPGALDEAARRYGMVRDDAPPRFVTLRPESPAAAGQGSEGGVR